MEKVLFIIRNLVICEFLENIYNKNNELNLSQDIEENKFVSKIKLFLIKHYQKKMRKILKR